MQHEDIHLIKVGTRLKSHFRRQDIIWTVKDTEFYALTAKNGLKSHLTPTNLWAFSLVDQPRLNPYRKCGICTADCKPCILKRVLTCPEYATTGCSNTCPYKETCQYERRQAKLEPALPATLPLTDPSRKHWLGKEFSK